MNFNRLSPAPRPVRALPFPVPPPAPAPETILIVDDEGYVRELLRHLLERNGYKVLTAANEESAREIFAAHCSEVNLLLADINLSTRESGFELAEMLQQTSPCLRILYTSGLALEEFNHPASASEASHFLLKPFHPGTLLEKVRTGLDEPATPQQLLSDSIRAF